MRIKTMRVLTLFVCFAVAVIGFSDVSHARKDSRGWSLFPKKVEDPDYKPYLNEQQIRQSTLWTGDSWTPDSWIRDAGDEKRIMRDFYTFNIVTNQYTDLKNIPVLEVGEPFVQLSGVDQRRVLEFVDYVFQITSSSEDALFYVFLQGEKKEPMGLFNKYGFQSY